MGDRRETDAEITPEAKALLDAAGAQFDRHARMRMIAPTLTAALIAGQDPAYSPPTQVPETKRQRQRSDRQRMARERDAMVRAQQEAADEAIAPAVQRAPVLAADGTVVRSARLERDGLTFKRSTPLVHLARRSEGMEVPTITPHHVRAAKRLADAWDVAGEGIGMGASDYGQVRGGAGDRDIHAGPGSAMMLQLVAQQEIMGAMAFLGALWGIIHAVVIQGSDVTSYAASVRKERKVVLGYLEAALDRLVEYWRTRRQVQQLGQVGIRVAVVVTSGAPSQPVDNDGPS